MGVDASGPEGPLTIYSIGHSNQSLRSFIALLQRHGIQSLLDVRSAPYSRYVPHFNRPELEDAVERQGIRYIYLGDELGGRPLGDEFYDAQDHVLYAHVANAPFFLRGLERLVDEGSEYRAAIMCSEEDPTNCHRHLLIARVLESQEVQVLHIRGDDREQTEEDLKPAPTLWDAEPSSAEEESEWKSIRPVSRRRLPSSSSSRSDEWGSDDSWT
ncbi:MAG TPA: DUF488 domain-containing protein [Ktedonobacterales bacterium]